MKDLTFTWLALLVVFFASSCGVEQPKFEITPTAPGLPTTRALQRGEIKEALTFYEATARLAEDSKDWETAALAYRQAARAAGLSGQLQKSIFYAEKFWETADKTMNPVHRARAVDGLIEAYASVRNFEKVRELIQKGFSIVREIPPNSDQRAIRTSVLYSSLGREHMRQQEYEKAIDAFSQSLYLWRGYLAELSSPRRRANRKVIEMERGSFIGLLASLGNAYRQAGRLEQAMEQYQEAFNAIREWGLKYPFENGLYEGMGTIYLRQRNFPQALENFQKAFVLAESQQRPAAISSASRRIGDTLRQLGKPAEAIPYYQKAILQIESTRSLLQSEEYRQSYFEGGLDAYIDMIDTLLKASKPGDAFSFSERARSRVFLDVLGSRVQLSRVKSGLLEEERALQERIAAIKARLSGEEDGETDRAGLRRELAEAEKAYSAFLAKVRKQDKEQASLMTVEPLTLMRVQELLDPGTTLVEYFVTNSNIHVWVIEKERSQYLSVQLRREELSKQVKAMRESIYSLGEREKFNEVSTSLYRSLIHPFLPRIAGKELIIVPHDVLHYLPFHALLSPEGKYLIETYPIYYLSSASLLQFTKEKRKAKGEKVLALGNPDLGDPSMNLRFAELEAKEVQELYPQSTVLLKKEATEEKAKAFSPQNDILHFATHAELSEDDPLSSAILLAKDGKEDGRLEVREIFGMDLKASLVVLSACETGLGKLSSGDELVGLTRAFIYAGTPSVVASLWKVEDSSTAALMARFYRNLKTMSKVEALRQAQLELIKGQASSDLLARRGIGGMGRLGETPKPQLPAPSSEPPAPSMISTSHPYFWAPFILVGDGK